MNNNLSEFINEEELNSQVDAPQSPFIVIPSGTYAARFVKYIEMGMRKQPDWAGRARPDAPMCLLGFELFGKALAPIINKTSGQPVLFYERLAIKYGEKANFGKLLSKMSYGRQISHMAKMLGEGFLISIVHNKGNNDRLYANMKHPEEGYLIRAPRYNAETNPLAEPNMKVVNVPEPTAPYSVLIWDSPSMKQWNSVFIDGSYTKNVNGEETEVSRNWIQQDILENATDFQSSKLKALLSESNAGQKNLYQPVESENPAPTAQGSPSDASENSPVPENPDVRNSAPDTPTADTGGTTQAYVSDEDNIWKKLEL